MTRALVVSFLLVAMGVAACGSDGSDQKVADDSQTTSQNSEEPTVVPEAAAYLLTEDELPAGWRVATGQEEFGVPEICGTRLEPDELVSEETERFTQGFSGPFVIQFSFVATSVESAARLVDPLAGSDLCSSFDIDGVTIRTSRIGDIDPVGDGFSALRGEAVDITPIAAREYLLFRNGQHVTVLVSTSPADLATREDLSAMATAIQSKV